MIKAALEYINGLKAPSIERYGGGTYSDKPLYQMTSPDFPTLGLTTKESNLASQRLRLYILKANAA